VGLINQRLHEGLRGSRGRLVNGGFLLRGGALDYALSMAQQEISFCRSGARALDFGHRVATPAK